VKIHLGCGQRVLKGYVHVDEADFDHIDYRTDVRSLPMFDDDSVDEIYASHLLEYFDRVEVCDVLAEWGRVLRPGGILRLAVPDFAALVQVYRDAGTMESVIGPLYGRWPVPGTDMVVYHRTVYDQKSLTEVLQANGFDECHLWDWREVFVGENLAYDDFSQAYYPHMDKENGLLISLNLEAVKR